MARANMLCVREHRLHSAYRLCRRLNAQHGKTYFFATGLLPPVKRPAVHALYGFARYADDLVDDPTADTETKATRLDRLAALLREGLATGRSAHPIILALVDTVQRYEIDQRHFDTFLTSMRQDLTVRDYRGWDELMTYMYGSAAVIGLELVPVLGHRGVDRAIVEPYAADLGIAFQLTNFLRDVGEDLRRGRIYLPQEDLAHFGIDADRLRRGVVDGRTRRLLAYEIARCREIYRAAEPGIRLVDATSQDCLRTAFTLYREILGRIEAADYRVFDSRAAVSRGRRAAVGLPAWGRALLTRAGGA